MALEPQEFSIPQHRRWLMFLLRPTDLLELLRIVSDPTARFAAGAMPPDVKVVDTFFDEERNLLGAMLESEYFEPVEVKFEPTEAGQRALAAWPRALFSLGETDEAERLEEDLWGEVVPGEEFASRAETPTLSDAMRAAVERGYQIRAFSFSAAELLQILQSRTSRDLPLPTVYPDDVRILGSIATKQIDGWTIFLEHEDFPPARVYQQDDMAYVEPTSDGHEVAFRFGFPGARVQRTMQLDVDEAENG